MLGCKITKYGISRNDRMDSTRFHTYLPCLGTLYLQIEKSKIDEAIFAYSISLGSRGKNTNKTVDEKETSDAVRQLRLLRFFGGRITRSTEEIVTLANGLPYCFAEVTCDNGSQFGIAAYGEEAAELFKEVDITKHIPLLMTTKTK